MTAKKIAEVKGTAVKKRAEKNQQENYPEKKSYSAHTHPRKVEFFISLAAIKKLRSITAEEPMEQKGGGR